ncbi:hypothetical protein [Streptomyces chromofuscus]|uniref:Uncharacterized protein n=1 Tax=Streptomyces chromofuscus TaxID=42881 RepID=A0A7M2T3D0_STRCW|nr:hypothetical protein [Streptomyces chromofuscus]QOV42395.1 hypothetical protein IPT68_21450 [Streptomyces chromofuscus]GGT27433.1 hypothetical protein GCM10010254_55110 [Streptomyces chromofuscus]
MIWWLKVRLTPTVLAAALAGYTLLLLTVRDGEVILPAISVNAGNTVPLAFFLPLIVAGPLAHCLDSRQPYAELTGIRRTAWLDTLLAAASMAAVLAATGLVGLVTEAEATLQAGRNTLFLTGLMLIARAVLGRAGIVVPLGWVFAVILLGRRTSSSFYSWAVTALPPGTGHATATAALSIAAGLAATYITARRLP